MEKIIISKYIEQARQSFSKLEGKVQWSSIILDNWRGIRLIYGADCVEQCKSKCHECKLFKLVGEDFPGIDANVFKTTLIRANECDLEIFNAKQKYLNCKTLEQYLDCFITWLTDKCHTEESIKEELDFVKGFKIIHLNGYNATSILSKEQEIKRNIVEECLKRMKYQDSRRNAIRNYSKEIGII